MVQAFINLRAKKKGHMSGTANTASSCFYINRSSKLYAGLYLQITKVQKNHLQCPY